MCNNDSMLNHQKKKLQKHILTLRSDQQKQKKQKKMKTGQKIIPFPQILSKLSLTRFI